MKFSEYFLSSVRQKSNIQSLETLLKVPMALFRDYCIFSRQKLFLFEDIKLLMTIFHALRTMYQ